MDYEFVVLLDREVAKRKEELDERSRATKVASEALGIAISHLRRMRFGWDRNMLSAESGLELKWISLLELGMIPPSELTFVNIDRLAQALPGFWDETAPYLDVLQIEHP